MYACGILIIPNSEVIIACKLLNYSKFSVISPQLHSGIEEAVSTKPAFILLQQVIDANLDLLSASLRRCSGELAQTDQK